MTAKKPSVPPQPETAPVRIWVLLDSSGSMESLQLNVVESLNAFVAEQAATDPATAISIHTFPSVPYARKAAGVITVLVDDVAHLTQENYLHLNSHIEAFASNVAGLGPILSAISLS